MHHPRRFPHLARKLLSAAAGGLCATLALSSTAVAEPFEPHVFSIPPPRLQADGSLDNGWFVDFRPEYRSRILRVEPLELNGTDATKVNWGEHRLRLDTSVGYRGIAAIHMQVDALDGVLFGDNGEFNKDPSPTSGVGLASKQPNAAGWRVGLLPGRDPLQLSSYGPMLFSADPLQINFLYGEVLLPFGILRVGRQPTADGGGITINDGRTGRNLWGISSYHEASDRILFGTKISELFCLLRHGKGYKVNPSQDNGVFLGLVYDYVIEDDITLSSDDLEAVSAQLDFKWKDPTSVLGDGWGPMRFTVTGNYRWDERFGTSIWAFPMRLELNYRNLFFNGELSVIRGQSREISEGFAALTNAAVTDQDIALTAARAVLEYKTEPVKLRLEWGFADGDPDPRNSTPMTITSWSRDTNLGLMLFKHTLAFQSARSASVGIENLRQIDAASFPLTEVATEGRVTNVNALFPQVFWDVTKELRLKAGVLFAWSATPVTDPIQTLLRWDGDNINDDAVNYHGGKPSNYWGTEFDLGLEWRYKKMFEFAIESAYLVPGDALRDENGDAVSSWMLETRFTFRP